MGVPKEQDDTFAFRMVLQLTFDRIRPQWTEDDIRSELLSAHVVSPWQTMVNRRKPGMIPPDYNESDALGSFKMSPIPVPGGIVRSFDVSVTTEHVHTLDQLHAYRQYVDRVAKRVWKHLPQGAHMRSRVEAVGMSSNLYIGSHQGS